MFDELSDIDFGTYFNVVSTKQQQQQQQQQNCNNDEFKNVSIPSPPLMNRNNSNVLSSSSSSSVSNSNNHHQQQQQSFYRNSILDWNINQQQQHNHHHHSPIHSTPDSSPQSSSSDYTLHSFSPPLHSPPFANIGYAYNRTKSISNDNNNNSFFVNSAEARSSYPSNNIFLNGDIPSITIPTTPTATSTPSHTVFSQSEPVFPRLSSLLNDNNLSTINTNIATIKSDDQEEFVHPLDIENNSTDHTTRNWRKVTNKTAISKGFGFLRGVEPEKQLKKVAHNAIERRYRNNINDRIHELKNAVPALYKARINEGKSSSNSPSGDVESDNEDESDEVIIEGVQVAKKLNKATILRKATEYICFLKNTNESTVQENMILQQIIAQMPGGPEALDQFFLEKNEFERYETERLARERRETLECERLERKKMLRERAAQRAALAQLLPKQERKPYRRRQSKKPTESNKKKMKTDDDGQDRNKMFMVGFMCLVFFTSIPGGGDSSEKVHHYDFSSNYLINQTADIPSRSLTYSTRFMSLDLWNILRICIGIFGLFYICLIPLLIYWLRPRPVKKSVVVVNKNSKAILPNDKKTFGSSYFHAMLTLYCIIRNIFISVTGLSSFFCKKEEEESTLSLVELNEAQCFKENSNATRLTILQNCTQMLVQLCTIKDPIVKARGYTAAGIQLKLWFNNTILLSYLTSYCLNKSQKYIGKINNYHHQQQVNSVSIQDQVIDFLSMDNQRHHSSLVVSATTTPLQLFTYFQQLGDIKTSLLFLLNNYDETSNSGSLFNENQLEDIRSKKQGDYLTTQASRLLEWFILAGMTLQDDCTGNNNYLDIIVDSTNADSCSPLFKSYQKIIYHTLEALQSYNTMKSSNDIDQTLFYLDQAFNYSIDTNKYISQEKKETDILMILALLVLSKMLESLLLATTDSKDDHDQSLTFYISELKEQVLTISSNSTFNVPGRIRSLSLESF